MTSLSIVIPNIQKFYFFRCYHCGEWYYSNKIIKTKRCWKCAKSFQFKNSTKFSQQCSLHEAIKIIKKLKEKSENLSLNKFLNLEKNIYVNFKLRK
ncbi:MAG: DUF1922 domain-containing protein [Candidatus Lokiarchaeota archaeon]|nr:DUF1922 domain-containing protein [Candidatus Lokiarchaeota archaeon]